LQRFSFISIQEATMAEAGGTDSTMGTMGTMGSSSTTDTADTRGNTTQDRIQNMNQRAHAAVDKAAEAAGKAAERMSGFPQELNDKTSEYVRAQPLKAVGIAFASGLLLGKLLR
jgi:ElaB/YqjD/DUF883 family membrane-anchored ribosome-binding protein